VDVNVCIVETECKKSCSWLINVNLSVNMFVE
jgi:hypothetical protein